ncbi:class I SAM-dependent methyltransferase [Corynebacterium guangdongense]|uniref:SAM-dependent methyltransferase n=1 Tax=Corynebacterium guangdongense TaxID=1783348 RepID=A0ABU2A135_9CORY|nr:class I SAM-dependent methyltransferase [Corynebacterium guangdongense]MDR7330881.1 SAM-dependent methyltransferase [Corynebacterium guangdongense]WJZ16896.1 hypothetical protein CGUA_01480 [Corynebacterium guangdongense]
MSPIFDAGADYAAHRPSYPEELPGLLADLPTRTRLALDVGCGTGQLTVPLADRFDRVIGVDVSESQIASAIPHERVSYRVGAAEDVSVDEPVDLVTVAQAAHWIDDLDAFYDRVRSLAAEGSAIALISYGLCHLEGLDEMYREFYRGDFHRFWDPRRRHVEEGLAALPFPFAPLAVDCPPIIRRYTHRQFIDYLGTWSATKESLRRGSTELTDFAAALADAWGDPGQPRTVTWPVTVRAGRIHD